ncbi:MAG: hypothetical protein JWN25_1622 [Verrucomicrobiales bacterium]|nr:hypothetical protein [Verrucomicrobiales bacterium]
MKNLIISLSVCLIVCGCQKEGERVAVNNQSNEFSIKINKEQLAEDARATKDKLRDAGEKIGDELGKAKDKTVEAFKKGGAEIKEKAGATRDSVNPQDEELLGKVKSSITPSNDGVKSSNRNVDIQVHDGKVTLTGSVPTDAEKQEIERTAKGIPGVQTVQNDLTVKP